MTSHDVAMITEDKACRLPILPMSVKRTDGEVVPLMNEVMEQQAMRMVQVKRANVKID